MRSILRALSALVLAGTVAGCVLDEVLPEGEEEELLEENIGSSEHAATVSGGMMTNALVTNALVTNALVTNALVTNALVTNSLPGVASNTDFRTAMNNSTSRKVMEYAIQCALAPSQTFTFTNTNGQTYTYRGMAGLYTSWSSGVCTEICQERITGCLIARSNARGVQERISIRHPLAGTISEKERQAFSVVEAVYLGNLWAPTSPYDADSVLQVGLAEGPLYDGSGASYAVDRFCAGDSKSCPIVTSGYAHERLTGGGSPYNRCFMSDFMCGGVASNGAFSSCYGTGYCSPGAGGAPTYTGPDSATYHSSVTVHRPNHASHSETTAGPALHRSESPCAYHVIVERADTYCETNSWDSVCVRKARESCGDHDLLVTGSPLVRGDSACIDRVCDRDSFCCSASGSWDSYCVAEARWTVASGGCGI